MEFSIGFPFTVENAKASRGEAKITYSYPDGTVEEGSPKPLELRQNGSNITLNLSNAMVHIFETIKIEPTLYYEKNTRTKAAAEEIALAGTPYEVSPAGLYSDVLTDFHYQQTGDGISYTVKIDGICNPQQKKPADSNLVLETLEFVFRDSGGNAIGSPKVVNVFQVLSGENFTKSGSLTGLPADQKAAESVDMKAKAVWKVGGTKVLLSETMYQTGIQPVSAQALQPELLEALPSEDGISTRVKVSFPYRVTGTQPDKIRIQVSGGAYTPNTSEVVPVKGSDGLYRHQIIYEIRPGETASFAGTLSYQEGGVTKTLKSPGFQLTPGHLKNAGGSLKCQYRDPGQLDYELNLSGIVNPSQEGGMGFQIGAVQFWLTSVSDGSEQMIPEPNAEQVLGAGTTTWHKKASLSTADIPAGAYQISADVMGYWVRNGQRLQQEPTMTRISCPDTVLVGDVKFQVSLPAQLNIPDAYMVTPVGMGVDDGSGNIAYQTTPLQAKPGQTVYLKLKYAGRNSLPCEIGELKLQSASAGGFTLESSSLTLPAFVNPDEYQELEYVYSFRMPVKDVSDIVIQSAAVSEYKKVSVQELAYDRNTSGGLNMDQESKAAFPYNSQIQVSPEGSYTNAAGEIYVKNGATVTVTATMNVMVTDSTPLAVWLFTGAGENIRSNPYVLTKYAVGGSNGAPPASVDEQITITFTVDETLGLSYETLVFAVGAAVK